MLFLVRYLFLIAPKGAQLIILILVWLVTYHSMFLMIPDYIYCMMEDNEENPLITAARQNVEHLPNAREQFPWLFLAPGHVHNPDVDGFYLDRDGMAFHRNEVELAHNVNHVASQIVSQNPGVNVTITLSNGTQVSTQALAQSSLHNILLNHCDNLREMRRNLRAIVLPIASPEYVPTAYPVSDFSRMPMAVARPASPGNGS